MTAEAGTQIVIAIASFAMVWTSSIIAGVIWLESRFRRVEGIFYKELDSHKTEVDEKFANHSQRVQRLELKAFGFTKTP